MSSYHTGLCDGPWAYSSGFKSCDVQPLGLATLLEALSRSFWVTGGLITPLWFIVSDDKVLRLSQCTKNKDENGPSNTNQPFPSQPFCAWTVWRVILPQKPVITFECVRISPCSLVEKWSAQKVALDCLLLKVRNETFLLFVWFGQWHGHWTTWNFKCGPAVAQHENIRINIWFLCNLTHFWCVESESDVKNG